MSWIQIESRLDPEFKMCLEFFSIPCFQSLPYQSYGNQLLYHDIIIPPVRA